MGAASAALFINGKAMAAGAVVFVKELTLFDRMSAFVFAILIVIVLATFRDYGIAWDDPFHERYGDLILRYFSSLGAERDVFAFRNLGLYGGLFDFPSALLAHIFPFEPFETRHLLIASTGLLGIGLAWAMARWMGGALAGFLAIVLLTATPSYWGHMFVNPKDIPFAVAYMGTLYFAARAVVMLPGMNVKVLLALGVCLGAAMGIRIGGVVLIAYLGALVLVHLIWLKGRATYSIGLGANIKVLTQGAGILVWPVMILTFVFWPSSWPWLVDHALATLMVMANYGGAVDVLYEGRTVSSVALPADYVPWHLAIKLPLVLLAGLIVAVQVACIIFLQGLKEAERKTVFGLLTLVLGAGFPVTYAMVKGSAHYDAIRHFLFVIPPLCVFVAVYVARALAFAWRRNEVLAMTLGGVFAFGVAWPVQSMVRLHPYEYTHYNALVGGIEGAEGRYELDYWALSYREAAERLRDLTAATGEGNVAVYVCGPYDSAARFLPARFRITDTVSEADFFLALTRWHCDERVEAPTLFEVTRKGVRLSIVKDLREGYTLVQELPKQIRIVEDYPRYGEVR